MDEKKSPQMRVELIRRARRMRSEPTQAEARLWNKLRKRQLNGLKFRRQHIIHFYIVDFYCPATKLVIEIDGPVHNRQEMYDQERDGFMEATGHQVIRFNNSEVEENLEKVLEKISEVCKRRIWMDGD